jgi:hypothetical protein
VGEFRRLTHNRRLVVVESQSTSAELLAENPVLLAKVMDDLQLALVPPAGDRDQHEPEWVQDSWHLVSLWSRAVVIVLMNQ